MAGERQPVGVRVVRHVHAARSPRASAQLRASACSARCLEGLGVSQSGMMSIPWPELSKPAFLALTGASWRWLALFLA